MARIKKEAKQTHYPPGTLVAVNLYDNGNFFEGEVKHYGSGERSTDEVFVQYLDDKESSGWIDLNVIQVVELPKDNVLTQEECVEKNITGDEKGYMGHRLAVLWRDDVRYSGTITKVLKDNKNFVFISYDDGDKCWFNLLPELQQPDVLDIRRKTAAKASKKMKKEEKSSSDKAVSLFEKKRKEFHEKYPIGSLISVDVYGDEHYHEAIVAKFHANPKRREIEANQQWIWVDFVADNSRSGIDLSQKKVIKMMEENIIRLDKLKSGDERGFLGKRIVVEWADGNKYCGKATRSARDNKYFVFVEYDDGDQCWCDLQRESEWHLEDEIPSDSCGEGEDAAGDSEIEIPDVPQSNGKSKRKGATKKRDKSTKKAKGDF